jgi:hypothetical protein
MSVLLASSAAATAALFQPGGGRPGLSQSQEKMATGPQPRKVSLQARVFSSLRIETSVF